MMMMMMGTGEGDSDFDYDLLMTKQRFKGLGRKCSAPLPGTGCLPYQVAPTVISNLGNGLTLHK